MTSVVSKSNETTIPTEIARRFDIRPGTQLEWSEGGNGSILIKPQLSRAEIAKRFRGAGKIWLKPGEDSVADLLRQRKEDDELDRQDERS